MQGRRSATRLTKFEYDYVFYIVLQLPQEIRRLLEAITPTFLLFLNTSASARTSDTQALIALIVSTVGNT
jgi:hypothetical protein